MCTAITFQTKDFYFGRTLDYEFSYSEEVVLTPRKMPLPLTHLVPLSEHYALIGMAFLQKGFRTSQKTLYYLSNLSSCKSGHTTFCAPIPFSPIVWGLGTMSPAGSLGEDPPSFPLTVFSA